MCLFFVWKSLEEFERYFFSTHNAGGGVGGGGRFKVNRVALSASFIEPDPWNVTSPMGGAFLSAPVHVAAGKEKNKMEGCCGRNRFTWMMGGPPVVHDAP